MNMRQQHLQSQINRLKELQEKAELELSHYSNGTLKSKIEEVLLYCLERSVDVTEGCILTSEARLSGSSSTLVRCLFELLVYVCWVTLSEENARIFIEAPNNELARYVRKNLYANTTKVIHEKSKVDHTQDYLNGISKKKIPRRLRIEELAKEAGLEIAYTMLYGPMSMNVHANTIGITSIDSPKDGILASIGAAQSLLKGINYAVTEWMDKHEKIPIDKIYEIMDVSFMSRKAK